MKILVFSLITILTVSVITIVLPNIFADTLYDYNYERWKNDPKLREESRPLVGAWVDLPEGAGYCISSYSDTEKQQLSLSLMQIKGENSDEEETAKSVAVTILQRKCPYLIFYVAPERVINLPQSDIDAPYSYNQIKTLSESSSEKCNVYSNPKSGYQDNNTWNYCMNYVSTWKQNELQKTNAFLEINPNYFKSSENSSKGGGCLIATATYGSELAPQVQQLREIRDSKLLQTESGTNFMNSFNEFYYFFSPTIADWERETPVFKEVIKITLTPMISSLSILNHVNMDSEESVLGYGISLILLNVGMYFVAPGIVIHTIRKRL